jgi:hypothetical protein
VTLAASSPFETIILPVLGVFVALAVGIAAAWATYVVGYPRQRLFYKLSLVAPLLTSPRGLPENLKLTYEGEALARPHIIEVTLISRGRRDIPRSAFDADEPIRLDVGVRILEMLRVVSEPETMTAPNIHFDETVLNVGPNLIGKRQKITFTLLADGASPKLSWKSSLEGVVVRRLKYSEIHVTPAFGWGMALGSGLLAVALWFYALVGTRFFPSHTVTTTQAIARAVFIATAVAATFVVLVGVILARYLWSKRVFVIVPVWIGKVFRRPFAR